jgi:hypothetical protein
VAAKPTEATSKIFKNLAEKAFQDKNKIVWIKFQLPQDGFVPVPERSNV